MLTTNKPVGECYEYGQGQAVGGMIETYWYCIPTYETYKGSTEAKEPEYHIHMPTCCGGMCVNCCAQGCCNCRIPFYFYNHDDDKDESMLFSSKSAPYPNMPHDKPEAQICKIWTGLGQELFSDADTFECKVPDGADRDAKVRVIAATLLLNQLYFEKDKNDEH